MRKLAELIQIFSKDRQPSVIDWIPYLESICQKYAQWWDVYTLTNVEGKAQKLPQNFLLQDLRVQTVETTREQSEEQQGNKERFTVLEGLRKYANNHVLLVGRPGSGKSTALARLLLEKSEQALNFYLEEQELTSSVQTPILIELRYYQTSIFDLVLQFLSLHDLILDQDTLKNTLLGKTLVTPLLLFDGINELPSEQARLELINFRRYYAKVPMVFTTRDLGIEGDLNIEKKLEMLALTEPQMQQFVYAYLPKRAEKLLAQLDERFSGV